MVSLQGKFELDHSREWKGVRGLKTNMEILTSIYKPKWSRRMFEIWALKNALEVVQMSCFYESFVVWNGYVHEENRRFSAWSGLPVVWNQCENCQMKQWMATMVPNDHGDGGIDNYFLKFGCKVTLPCSILQTGSNLSIVYVLPILCDKLHPLSL